MLKYEKGMLVRSLAGHDSGKLYIIIEENSGVLYLADGSIRTKDRPKKKKTMHGQLIKVRMENEKLTDSDIRSFLKKYQKVNM